MNKAESEALEEKLRQTGWKPAPSNRVAGLVIINTCSVRKTAENRIWGRLGYYKYLKQTRDLTLAVIGCMVERLKQDLFDSNREIDVLVGSFEKTKLIQAIETSRESKERVLLTDAGEYHFDLLHNVSGFKALLPIMHGCNNFCTYCIVPLVRGKEISRDPQQIFREIGILEDREIREITLLGQNVNSFSWKDHSLNLDFPGLLEVLSKQLKNILWLRFLTSHPKDFSDRLISVIREQNRICKHIHLPVQHGSDRILTLMNRKYTRSDYIKLVEKIKNKIPEISLTTDLLIGFPGETEQDFRDTLNLMKTIQFEEAFTYKYNPREGTEAFQMADTVSEKIKTQRLSQVIELQNTITRQKRKSRLGEEATVLLEGPAKRNNRQLIGRTERDEMVVCDERVGYPGTLVQLKLADLSGNTFVGEECI